MTRKLKPWHGKLDDEQGRLRVDSHRSNAWHTSRGVELRGDALVFQPISTILGDEFVRAPLVEAQAGLLDEFEELVEAGPESILRFAEKWGSLGLCRHEMPAAICHQRRLGGPARCLQSGAESVTAWRRVASAVKAALTLAAGLHDGTKGSAAAWTALLVVVDPPHLLPQEFKVPGPEERARDLARASLARQRAALAWAVSSLLEMGSVVPRLQWGGPKLEDASRPLTFELSVPPHSGLWGAIAIQLASAVAKRKPPRDLCVHCGHVIQGRRRPNGTVAWCDKPECRREKNRVTVAEWRQKQRDAAANEKVRRAKP